jgi:hypothetical protein
VVLFLSSAIGGYLGASLAFGRMRGELRALQQRVKGLELQNRNVGNLKPPLSR